MKKVFANKNEVILFGILIIVCLIFSTFIHLKLINNAQDDAFIHIRIADNFSRHNLLYFNLEDRVYSTSSFLWTLFLGIVFKFTSKTPEVVAIINSFSLVTGCFLSTLAFSIRAQRKFFSTLNLFFGIGSFSILFSSSIGLMETPFAFLIFSIVLLSFSLNLPLFYLGLGIIPFVRLEFSIYLLLLIAHTIVSTGFRNIKYILLSAFSFSLIFIAIYSHFGTVLPNTITAKPLTFDMNFTDTFAMIIQSMIPLKLSKYSKLIIGCLSLLTVIAVSFVQIKKNWKMIQNKLYDYKSLDYILIIGATTTVFSYTFSRNMLFDWYIPIYLLPAWWSILEILSKKRNLTILMVAIVIILGPIFSTITICDQAVWSKKNITLSSFNARVRTYINTGKWLDAKYKNETLMTSEIGGLGYGYKGYIYDGGGLVSPDALKYHPITYPGQQRVAIPLGYIKEKDPDIIVSFDTFITEFLDSEIVDNYVRIKRPAFISDDREKFHEVFGSSYINIFIHKRVYKP